MMMTLLAAQMTIHVNQFVTVPIHARSLEMESVKIRVAQVGTQHPQIFVIQEKIAMIVVQQHFVQVRIVLIDLCGSLRNVGCTVLAKSVQ
jgi:hypothetical protein